MRTPVASKKAFATAPLMPTVGGSPEPERFQPWAAARVFPSLTSTVMSPGVTFVYLPGWTLISVTVGESLNRRIGYVTQSRLVTRSLFHCGCSYSARERPWIIAPVENGQLILKAATTSHYVTQVVERQL